MIGVLGTRGEESRVRRGGEKQNAGVTTPRSRLHRESSSAEAPCTNPRCRELITSLQQAALVDLLTGCRNRRALDTEFGAVVAAARRASGDIAVIVADLDGLKATNDGLGHLYGDARLRAFASALRNGLRESDLVYRFGGDEFVIVIPSTDRDGAIEVMNRISLSGSPPFSWGATSLQVCTGSPSEEVPGSYDPFHLIAVADTELYEAKRRSHASSSMGRIPGNGSTRWHAEVIGAPSGGQVPTSGVRGSGFDGSRINLI